MLSLESLHYMPFKGDYVVHNNVLCCCGYNALTSITYTTFSTGTRRLLQVGDSKF